MASWKTVLGLILSGFGVAASLSSFVFLFFGNYHAAIWALISGLLAAVDFHLYYLHWRNNLVAWHNLNTLKDFQILAIVGMVFGIAASIWYIFYFIYYNLPILPVPDSYQIAAVWSFMTAKWGLGLYLTSRHLISELEHDYPQLLPSPSYSRNVDYIIRVL
uniref:Uncharacterized protein n=1 Tax=Homalodisca liturata TaxID=320908 RepID=A0A1B6J3Z6_9HEMI